jgi:hypothetical protein
LSLSEIQTSDGQNIFVGNDTCKRNYFIHLNSVQTYEP